MPDKLDRVRRYLSLIDEPVKLKEFLGSGTDGAVWATTRDEDNDRQGRELFGDNRPAAQSLMASLESFLIFYLDPKPHNIVFPTGD
jgi:hypothetical protein